MIRLGLEPKTPTLKVLSLKAFKSLRLRLVFQMQPAEQANLSYQSVVTQTLCYSTFGLTLGLTGSLI